MDPRCSCEKCELKELFFENLKGDHLDIICSGKTEKEHKQGQVIVKEGTPITDFIYLKSGLVKLFISDPAGREQIITLARPMDYVSLLSVFSTKVYNYSVTALEDSVTCSLKMADIRMLVENNGPLSLSLMQKMSRIADRIILDSLEFRKKHLRGRVAHLLIYFAEKVYDSDEFDLPLTRKEMAEYIGMSAENVIRSLSEFRKDGILKIFGKTILVVQMETLKSIAEYG
jgi:CRP/FNR family transcriptional regulator